MSKGPNTKDEGTARRRRRKASLRVPSDTVPRRPVEEPATDESRLAVSVAYALDEGDEPESGSDGKSIHDMPTLINQPALPERGARPDTEETPVPEIVTERLPSIDEADDDDDDETVIGGDEGAGDGDELGDDEVTRAAHQALGEADEDEGEDEDDAADRGSGASAADASSTEQGSPDEESIPEIESAQVEAIVDEDDEVEADSAPIAAAVPAAGGAAAAAAPAPEPAPEPAPASRARPGSGGDSVDIPFDDEEEDPGDGVPEEVVELTPTRAPLGPRSSAAAAAAQSAPADQAAPADPGPPADQGDAPDADAAAPAPEPSRPRFVRARTMALSDADLEEMMEEARGNEAARAASAPDALDAGESGEILADDMLEEISDGEDAAPEAAATAQVVDTAPEPAADKAAPDKAAPDKPPPPTPKVTRPSPPPAPARAAAVAAVGQVQPRARQRQGKPWFEEVFDEDYLRTLPFLTPRATQNEANFVMESFGIDPGAQVLDVACGYGRHAMELAARGYHVVGLDNSLPLLLRGADEAQRRGLTINFVHGDMREMTFDSQFDGAYCLFSSFGFFDDETNKKVAQNVARALKPGARFVVEVLNRDYLVADLPSRVWWEGDGCVVLEEVEFNYFSSRIVSSRSVVFDDGRQLEQEISLRAFSLHELGKLLHAAGFRVVEISGSMATRGRFLGAHSRDIVVVAERRGGKKDGAE